MTTTFPTGGPEGQSLGMLGGIYVASSFGVSHTTMGPPSFRAREFIDSMRVKMLARREAYYRCTQHDYKMFDFDGRMIPPGPPLSQPMLSAEQYSYYVPLKLRRPAAPYRLGRVIVNTFTSLLFGYGRWPAIRVDSDAKREKFAKALAKAAKLRTVMIRARNVGGSVGTVGLSWRYCDGRPRVQVHNGKHLFVHEWADHEALVPAHVSEIYTYSRPVFGAKARGMKPKWFWYRRDWTENSDVAFKEIEFQADVDPQWDVDERFTTQHNDGRCHMVWVQNLPEDDTSSIDGQPDYAELYESFDALDIVKSVVVRGATLNLDPTLVLKMDPDILQRTGIKKGSDSSLIVGKDGNAAYLELAGTSIQAGNELLQKLRDAILESAQCVVPDPNKIGAQGTSSVALKVIHAPSIAKSDILREQYGTAIQQLLDGMVESAARNGVGKVTQQPVAGADGQPVMSDNGIEVTEDVMSTVALPPEATTVNDTDPATGEVTTHTIVEELQPGESGSVELDWGEYFNPTADDRARQVQSLQMAVVSKIMSKQSGAEETAVLYDRNPQLEAARVMGELAEAAAQTEGMFPPIGGEAAEPKGPTPIEAPAQPLTVASTAEAGSIQLGVNDIAKIVMVNEARASQGLPPLRDPDGNIDPDGNLTVSEFAAKRAAAAAVTGEAAGTQEAEAQPAAPAEPQA